MPFDSPRRRFYDARERTFETVRHAGGETDGTKGRMNAYNDAMIVESWARNAAPWTEIVRRGRSASRGRVTDRAIVDTVLGRAPRSVLDAGCGEGWLARELAARNIEVIGIDAVPALIQHAAEDGGDFRVLSYEDVAAGKLKATVDAIVCNFSLLGKASVEALFAAAPSLLAPRGSLIVQTLHPIACGARPYQDGWREDAWQGCGEGFSDPAPWYFRTLESWITLFETTGFRLREMREPRDPDTGAPASVIFCGELPP